MLSCTFCFSYVSLLVVDCCLMYFLFFFLVFFFKQKTAYEMRISDWSSDVCSSDLLQDALVDDLPDPETVAADRHALAKLIALLPDLPERCRRILEMRKFDGLSQREIAAALGVTESVVENDEIGRAPCRERLGQYV